jgi:methyl-accepting chemotaxis protein
MNFFLNLYLHLKVRTRIFLLCLCYSLCIIFAVGAGRMLSTTVSIISTAVFVILGAIFCGLLFWSINDALKRILNHLATMANGDLTQSITPKRNNEISTIIRSIATVQTTMRDIIAQISGTSEQVAQTSRLLQTNASQIATGAENIESQTSAVAIASEEMASTSINIARSCFSAAESSKQASSVAGAGAEIVRQTTKGMERISKQVKGAASIVADLGARSEQIGQIIGTIEDIADQTNLLALNAAIEAARAGEQGRGFAVVADEVRALAERTTRATREIGDMIKAIQGETRSAVSAIEESVAEVELGAEHSIKSAQALDQILVQITDVTMQINQVAASAEEQTATTDEISSNVQQVTDVVRQTAQGAIETTDAASQLSRESEQLQKLVGQFKLI